MNSPANTILITKTVDAPRERVYRAFLDAADLKAWHHATDGWTTPHAESDPKVGGAFNIGFRSPDGAQGFDFVGTYDELVEPERIVYTIADGRKVWIALADEGGKTRVDLTLTLETENSAELQRAGWGGMLENLATHLA